jgi:hypothetical protein
VASRNVVGLAPKGSGGGGRTVVGLAPAQSESGRTIVGLPPGAQVGKTKHRSFLGRVGHVVGQKAELAARDIKGIPGGVIDQANTAVVQPWKDVLTTGHVSKKTNKRIDTLIQDTADSTRHALEHPGADPFATALTLLPALHGAGRVAETVARVDRNAPRTLRTGDTEVPLIPSRNAAGRIGQKIYDKTLQRGLDKNPQGRVAAHAQKRIGGALAEEQRLQQRTRAVPAAMLDKAALKISRGRTPGLRREKQAALELTSVNTAPEEAAAYHLGQAEKGVNPQRNKAVAALYQRVADKGYLTKDGKGNVTVDAEKFPQLAKVDARLADVQARGDETLAGEGCAAEGGARAARQRPRPRPCRRTDGDAEGGDSCARRPAEARPRRTDPRVPSALEDGHAATHTGRGEVAAFGTRRAVQPSRSSPDPRNVAVWRDGQQRAQGRAVAAQLREQPRRQRQVHRHEQTRNS